MYKRDTLGISKMLVKKMYPGGAWDPPLPAQLVDHFHAIDNDCCVLTYSVIFVAL